MARPTRPYTPHIPEVYALGAMARMACRTLPYVVVFHDVSILTIRSYEIEITT
jgi:hypothetical protein